MEKQLTDWEILKTFTVTYNGSLLEVKLVLHQRRARKEWFFEVANKGQRQFLLSKRPFLKDIVWIGGGINYNEAQLIGPEIERQSGCPLPMAESLNPFEYTGDIEIRIERFLMGELPVEKAKNPYCADMWYRVHLPSTTIEIVYAQNITDDAFSWFLESPSNLAYEDFQKITELVDLYEKRRSGDNL